MKMKKKDISLQISPVKAIPDEYLPQIMQITQKNLMYDICFLFSKLLKVVLILRKSVKSVAKNIFQKLNSDVIRILNPDITRLVYLHTIYKQNKAFIIFILAGNINYYICRLFTAIQTNL